MINYLKESKNADLLFNSVQESYSSVSELPEGLLLLDSLKTLETDLQRRNLLDQPSTKQIHSLWFLSETERNIFLWRNGFSLIDLEKFEFWVDINNLIEKRINQINNFDPDNPFFNSLWGFANSSKDFLEQELRYIHSFTDLMKAIINHASALSTVTSLIHRELSIGDYQRKIIILPSNLHKTANKKAAF